MRCVYWKGATLWCVGLLIGCSAGPTALPSPEALQAAVDGAPTLEAAAIAASLGNRDVQGELDTLLEKMTTQPSWSEAYKRELLVARAEVLHRKYQEFPTAAGHFAAGERLEHDSFVPEAYHQYAMAAAKASEIAKYWAGMGRMALVDGRAADGLAHYEKALALQPDAGGWLLERGNCHYALKEDAAALEDYERAQVQMPDYAPIYERMAVVYWRKGDYRRALELLEMCKSKGGHPRAEFEAQLEADSSAAGG